MNRPEFAYLRCSRVAPSQACGARAPGSGRPGRMAPATMQAVRRAARATRLQRLVAIPSRS